MKNYFYKYLLYFGLVKERRSIESLIDRKFLLRLGQAGCSIKAANSLSVLYDGMMKEQADRECVIVPNQHNFNSDLSDVKKRISQAIRDFNKSCNQFN